MVFFFFSSRRRHTRSDRDWSSDVCSSDLNASADHWVVGPPHWWETSPGNHAVFVYGYEPAGLLIENQWGTGWGKDGYAVLNWDFVLHYAFEAASIVPLYPPPAWMGLPGGMTDISVGANGSIWAIGSTPVYDGYPIYHWNPSTWMWDQVEGAAARIAVDPTGNPWVVNSFGLIYRRTGNT